MFYKILFYLLIISFSSCIFLSEKEEPIPENPYRAEMLRKLRQKIECVGCNPTKQELVEYYFLKNETEFQRSRVTGDYSNSWQNHFRTYFLYFPNNLKNPWYTPGSGSANGGRAPGMYYPPYGLYGNGYSGYGHHGHGRR